MSIRYAELFLDLLERDAHGLGNHCFHPEELEAHHAREERENVTGRESGNRSWEECRERGGEDPVRKAAESLALSAMTIGKYLGDEDPDDRALADGVGCDEREDTNWNDGKMLRKESPSRQAERRDVSERADIKKSAAAQAVNKPQANKSENEIGDADANGLQ
jgi:hypothetical protein